MFRPVQFPVKHSCSLKIHRSSYASLPQPLPATIPIDEARRKLLDDLPSAEKKRRKKREKEDPSMFDRCSEPALFSNDHSPLPESRTNPSWIATPVASFAPPDIQECLFSSTRTSLCPYCTRTSRDARPQPQKWLRASQHSLYSATSPGL